MDKMTVHDKPSQVEARPDGVHVDGPADVAIVLTPKAALETAKRLGNAAVEMLIAPQKDQSKSAR